MFHKVTQNTENKALQKQIDRIKSLSGLTQNDFEALYVATIDRWIEFKRKPNEPRSDSDLLTDFDQVILALKRRQGYLLPLDSDSETAFREREEWTYAVFTASLLQSLDSTIRFSLAKALLPSSAFAWLHRNKTLFNAWQMYLNGDVEHTIFNDLLVEKLDQVKEQAPIAPLKNTVVALPEHITNSEIVENQVEFSFHNSTVQIKPSSAAFKMESLPVDAVIKEVDLTTLKNSTSSVPNEQSETESIAHAEKIPTLVVAEFWRWLKQAVTRNHITLNEIASVVHGVEGGLLIVLPQAIEAFIKHYTEQQGFADVEGLLKQQAPLMRAIKKQNLLIRKTNGSRIHAYCVGRWETRNTLTGVVINAPAFLGESFTLPINAQLIPDPLDNA